MFLGKRIKNLREEKVLFQRQLATNLEIDTPIYSLIEHGKRKAKREQILKLAEMLVADKDELLTLWLAGQDYEIVKDEEMGQNALEMRINQKISNL